MDTWTAFLRGTSAVFLYAVLTFLAGLIGGLIGSYARQKGQNLATREDIGELTGIVKKVEAEISDRFWEKQRLWELRRDAVMTISRSLRHAQDVFIEFDSTFAVSNPAESILSARKQRFEECAKALDQFDNDGILAHVTCSKTLYVTLLTLSKDIRVFVLLIGTGVRAYSDSEAMAFHERFTRVGAMLRDELKPESISPSEQVPQLPTSPVLKN